MKRRNKKIGYIDSDFLYQTRKVCKCGHRVNFLSNIPYIECTHCHQLIFRDKKAEFDYKIKRRLGVYKHNKTPDMP